ncbi:MAG: phosphoribosylaminoimidazolesuccinocarboxamide synthase [Candidatus Eisenbacteria bacterium]|uniref:Phosphoribosylaminoimidazole-succinocarboxamide synthase n=1 Tax=Eiseniibacteriota bacterium TaxID=2212470 RepID=A0A538UED1_UNCEI|nr:MAG: phosphoribosylaminoimidazolesuccinocarboxamide synthase [Candidatus Eisenbacteria bacterium]
MIGSAAAVARVELPGLTPWRQGKVRDLFAAGPEHLVIVASDRLSAYDHILPTPIPGKGRVLTGLSVFWFETLRSAAPHHFVSDDPSRYPAPFDHHAERLAGRSMLVRRAERIDIECVVRGHLTGSGWREYRATGAVCGVRLAAGLDDGAPLDPPIFTPATKADQGHDENVSFAAVVARAGRETAEALRARSLALFAEARDWAWARGLVLADTKFEFGRVDGTLTLIDEILSPDSSRYWDRAEYEAGRRDAFDKQIVRDWLDRSGWDHEAPAPALPDEVAARTAARYAEALRRLTGSPA